MLLTRDLKKKKIIKISPAHLLSIGSHVAKQKLSEASFPSHFSELAFVLIPPPKLQVVKIFVNFGTPVTCLI